MSLLQFPDWQHIGWRIGKKLKDIISPSPQGPSKEERLARRLQDSLNGFSYFDEFDEVEKWHSHDLRTYQRANTPLIQRPEHGLHAEKHQKSKLILCHDYKGGYHDYEGVRPLPVLSASFSCQYLQYVDTFIYFSHKLVCIPPPTWINALHRNGVKVLGTFLLEPQTSNANHLFLKIDDKYRIAEQLAAMALCYGFDGWLLNIEKEFSTNMTTEMLGFIAELRNALGTGYQVIWYDALTVENELRYQNGLTSKNLKFAQAAGALFTNYKWTESDLHKSKVAALENGVDPIKVLFGIDTWAQNTDMPGPRRVTYPSEGGGGTNTGLATSVLSQHGFSTAIFAPAWTYEHFPTNTPQSSELPIAKAVDQAMWEGVTLPDELDCDCRKGKPHHTVFYKSNPIIKQIEEFPVGSQHYFETHFTRGFEDIPNSGEEKKLLPTIGWQDPMPILSSLSIEPHKNDTRNLEKTILYGEFGCCESASLDAGEMYLKLYIKMKDASAGSSTGVPASLSIKQQDQWLSHKPLCMLSMDPKKLWVIKAICSRTRAGRSMEMGIYVAYQGTGTSGKDEVSYEYHSVVYDAQAKTPFATSTFVSGQEQGQLRELGVYCKGGLETPRPVLLMELKMLSVVPESAKPDVSSFTVRGLKIIEHGDAPYTQKCFEWTWQGSRDGWPDTLPWSGTTGPFAYFQISINGRLLGRAYSTELPMVGDDMAHDHRDSKGRLIVRVTGHFFGSFPSSHDHIASLEI